MRSDRSSGGTDQPQSRTRSRSPTILDTLQLPAPEAETRQIVFQAMIHYVAGNLVDQTCQPGHVLKNRSSFRLRGGLTPFGYDYVESKIEANNRELHIVRTIIELWNAGSHPSAIARKLERLKLKTRRGGGWDHSLITDIILRAQDEAGPYKNVAKISRPYVPRRSPKKRN